MVDEEHIIWPAPGFGITRKACGECQQQIVDLEWPKIDNVIKYTHLK
jgi:hypothetical protein